MVSLGDSTKMLSCLEVRMAHEYVYGYGRCTSNMGIIVISEAVARVIVMMIKEPRWMGYRKMIFSAMWFLSGLILSQPCFLHGRC